MTHKNTVHGHASRAGISPTYSSWQRMLDRCLNKNNPRYAYYGGIDITVCERWLYFQNFLEDMGEKPEGLTLERINNNQGYYPENCKWATYDEQAANKGNYKNNTSGCKGVSWCQRGKAWQAYINRKGKRMFLGYYKDIEDAINARRQAEI